MHNPPTTEAARNRLQTAHRGRSLKGGRDVQLLKRLGLRWKLTEDGPGTGEVKQRNLDEVCLCPAVTPHPECTTICGKCFGFVETPPQLSVEAAEACCHCNARGGTLTRCAGCHLLHHTHSRVTTVLCTLNTAHFQAALGKRWLCPRCLMTHSSARYSLMLTARYTISKDSDHSNSNIPYPHLEQHQEVRAMAARPTSPAGRTTLPAVAQAGKEKRKQRGKQRGRHTGNNKVMCTATSSGNDGEHPESSGHAAAMGRTQDPLRHSDEPYGHTLPSSAIQNVRETGFFTSAATKSHDGILSAPDPCTVGRAQEKIRARLPFMNRDPNGVEVPGDGNCLLHACLDSDAPEQS